MSMTLHATMTVIRDDSIIPVEISGFYCHAEGCRGAMVANIEAWTRDGEFVLDYPEQLDAEQILLTKNEKPYED
jgi:hypothetical protein